MKTEERPGEWQLDEVNGFLELGMVQEGFALAREKLAAPDINFDSFWDVVDALLRNVDDLKSWVPSVVDAYSRLTADDQRSARFLMLWCHNGCGNHQLALPFIPKQFDGPVIAMNLSFAVDTLLSLGRINDAAKLIPQCREVLEAGGVEEFLAILREQVERFEKLSNAI